MTCNKTAVGAWEAFTVTVVGAARENTNVANIFDDRFKAVDIDNISKSATSDVYPNPLKGNKFNLALSDEEQTESDVMIVDSKGEVVWTKSIKDNATNLSIEKDLKPGLYYVQIKKGISKTVKRLVVE
jgi:hypothetical protein